MKKSLALMLALIMVLCMIPTTALAANGTGHQISVKIYKVVLDSSKPLGYQNPELVNTITVICQDATGHSGYNHSVKLKEFYPTNFGLPTTDWTGWQFDSYYTKGKDNNTFYNFTSSRVNATANVTGSEPYSCSKNFYLVYKEAAPQTQDITLTYNANGGSGAPEPQTQTVESGKEATFTVNSKEPTRTNYDFKGWSTAKNAAAAEYKGGDSITISQDTTLYAVWANHEHKDENSDGYCDTDHECMHEKDQGGYCIVDGCTHPHEGDGACCPKKSDNKPERPEPENTSKPVAGLTSKDAVEVECITKNSGHAKQAYQLIADSYDVGAVSGNKEKGYTCEITVKPEKYVTQYNLDIEVEHKLVRPENYTITLNWDAADGQWKYTENKLPVTFTVMCEVQPPLDKTIPIEVSKTWHDDSGAVVKPEKITVNLLKNGTVVENAPIMPDNEGTWFHRFDNMPANDINDNPINYTVKEEDVPGWTPYYWTAGPSNDKLFFQIHNVPTKNTREIKVTKKVSGDGADKTKEFDFKVTLLAYHNGDMETPVGWYQLGDIYTFGGVTFTNGEAAFKLKDGESFTITGIPSHLQYKQLQYKVEETAPSGYTVKVNGSAGNSISNVFTDAKTVEINFENIKESGTNPTPSPSTDPSPTPTPTPGGGNGGGHSHYYPTTTPVPVIVIPPKTGDMTIWQSILHFLGII